MTIAIKRENGDLIWFDAVTEFGRQYRGSVSSNPIETGGKITDHITTENPVFTLTAVVSDADIQDQQQRVREYAAGNHPGCYLNL